MLPQKPFSYFSHKLLNLYILFLTALLILTACQGNQATPTRDITAVDIQVSLPTPTLAVYVFKTSEPGTAAVHGMLVVLNPLGTIPASDDAVYLVPLPDENISTIPQFDSSTAIQAEVNEVSGEFMITNLLPGSYAVIVQTKGGAQIPSRFYPSGNFAIFTITPEQIDTIVELDKLSLP